MSARLILTGSVVGQCDFLGNLATGYVLHVSTKISQHVGRICHRSFSGCGRSCTPSPSLREACLLSTIHMSLRRAGDDEKNFFHKAWYMD